MWFSHPKGIKLQQHTWVKIHTSVLWTFPILKLYLQSGLVYFNTQLKIHKHSGFHSCKVMIEHKTQTKFYSPEGTHETGCRLLLWVGSSEISYLLKKKVTRMFGIDACFSKMHHVSLILGQQLFKSKHFYIVQYTAQYSNFLLTS